MEEKEKILIVDDHPENLIALEHLLEHLNVIIIRALSGNEALNLILEHNFAMALVDVQMPGMDGYEMVKLMRQDRRGREVAVIFLSAIYSETRYHIKGIDSGAIDFITKPFVPEILIGKVRLFLELCRHKQDLLKKNEELNRYYNQLEKLVTERTQELFSVNTELQQEIAVRKETEKSLRESEKKLYTAQEMALLGNWEFDIKTNTILWSDQVYRIFGLPPDKDKKNITYENFIGKIHKDDHDFVVRAYNDSLENKTPYDITFRIVLEDNSVKYVIERCINYYDKKGDPLRSVGTIQDITERVESEKKVKESLKEKESLLRELYHRTKNNMQVIISMMGLKTSSIDNEEILDIFMDIENKIRSMALVHEKLYKSQNLSNINLNEYITELVQLMMESYSLSTEKVAINLDLAKISVLIDTAIPCGLIVNELLSNSFKYAFPGNRKGELSISLKEKGNNIIELQLSDNGIGLPESFDLKKSSTLGLQLIQTLSEGQLQGKIGFKSENGTSCTIIFPNNIYHSRV